MRFVRKAVIAVAAISMSIIAASASASHAVTDPAASSDQFFTLLNATRNTLGHAELQRDSGLDALALDWSNHMADVYDATRSVRTAGLPSSSCDAVSALCHRPALGASGAAIEPAWRAIGENVGTGGAIESLHEAFVASPGHFANIVGNYNRVGIGVVVRNERVWVTFNFLLGPPLAKPTAPTEGAKSKPTTGGPSLPVLPLGGKVYYKPVDPNRIVDTRNGTGGAGPVAPNSIFTISLASAPGRPAGSLGAALNITATGSGADGYLTVFPCGTPVPQASNVNFSAGQSVPNLIAAPFGSNNTVCVFTSARTHLLVDIAGWFGASSSDNAIHTTAPSRILDSRATGVKSRFFAVSLSSVAPSDATAATVNITVTDPQGDGYVTSYPCGGDVPNSSSVNFSSGENVPNLAIVRIGTARSICFYSSVPTHLIVDSAAWFGATGGALHPVLPNRVLDTRNGTGGWSGRLGKGQIIDLPIGSLPGMDRTATGAIMNVTAASGEADGYVTVYPCGGTTPTASNLNFVSGHTVANLVAVDLPADGHVCFYASERVDLIADLAGFVSSS
jgi:uncharacterized protein YkwD